MRMRTGWPFQKLESWKKEAGATTWSYRTKSRQCSTSNTASSKETYKRSKLCSVAREEGCACSNLTEQTWCTLGDFGITLAIGRPAMVCSISTLTAGSPHSHLLITKYTQITYANTRRVSALETPRAAEALSPKLASHANRAHKWLLHRIVPAIRTTNATGQCG